MTAQPLLTFLETRDPSLLDGYFRLRERVFRAHYHGLPNDFGREDQIDRESHIVVASCQAGVAAGARLTISEPGSAVRLPLEASGISVRDCLRKAGLDDNQPCAEISRQAVDTLLASGLRASLELADYLRRLAARLGIDTIFSICPEGAARINKRNTRACGAMFTIHEGVYTMYGIPMRLCSYSGILRSFRSKAGEI
jgi:hypothetical protein